MFACMYTGTLADELHIYEMETTSLIPHRVLSRQLKYFTGGNEKEEIGGVITKALASSTTSPSLSLSQSKKGFHKPPLSSTSNTMTNTSTSVHKSPSKSKASSSSFSVASPIFDIRHHLNGNSTEEAGSSSNKKVKRKKLPSIEL